VCPQVGAILLAQGRLQEAVDAFEKARAQGLLKGVDDWRQLASAYLRLQRPKEAVAVLTDAIRSTPGAGDQAEFGCIYGALASAQLEVGDEEGAAESRKVAQRLGDTADEYVAQAKGWARGRFGPPDYTEAARCLELAADKGSQPALVTLALMHRIGMGVPRDPRRVRELTGRLTQEAVMPLLEEVHHAARNGDNCQGMTGPELASLYGPVIAGLANNVATEPPAAAAATAAPQEGTVGKSEPAGVQEKGPVELEPAVVAQAEENSVENNE
jgi:tetratricopeptide (TPR) repeat protein